jgi:predicted nucleic acid-binding protein
VNNLIDSSAWIEFFKGNQKFFFINELINANAICINDIILSELLPSIIHKKEHALADLLRNVKNLNLNINWQEIREIQILNLKHGNSNIGIPDIIIVQNCLQNDLRIIAQDRHFIAMEKYIELKVYK